MEMQALLELQMMMFLLIAVGIIIRKLHIMPVEGKAVLTDLVMDILLPCNIIHSFQIDFNHELLLAGLEILIVSLVLQLFCTLISASCYQKVPKRQRMILQYGTVCSNASFLGNPVAEELYGSLGLLYASIYLIPQRVVMWSAGISYFTESPSKTEIIKKVMRHPCIISVLIGLVIMIAHIRLPGFLDRSITSLGGCTTAITMLLIGAILADAGFQNMVNRFTLLFSFIRLIAIPVAVMAGCRLFHVETVAAGVSTVLAAMPAGSTTAILAAKYHGDETFASQCIVLTTLLSMAILPIWCVALDVFL